MENILQRKKYVIHTQTKNMSFLQTANDLKTLGIENHYFFLKLYDPSLRNVDPHSPLLTEDMMIRIINECIINPWYFLREVCRIPDQGGNGVPFLLDRGNVADIWCLLNGIQFYDVRPRQTGKTQSVLAILCWAFLFGTSSSEFMFIGKDQELANLNLDRMKKQRDLLPTYMHFKTLIDEDGKNQTGTDNVRSLTNVHNSNKIVTKPRATSKLRAESIARGFSQTIQMFDELEYTDHIKTIVQVSGPAYGKAASNAKRNGAIYGRILLSTPGDLDSPATQDAMEILGGTCRWSEKFYDMKKIEVDEYIEKNSINGIVYIEYSHKQLGLDEEWVKRTSQTLLNDPIMIKREIYLRRIRGSQLSPFEQEDLETIDEGKGEIKEEIFINKFYKLDIYEKLDKRKVYIVGVDCGAGTGNDSTALTVIDPYTEKPVAEFKSAFIGTEDAKKFLFILVKKYIPRAILCIERNHVGGAIIEGLKEMGLLANLYFDHTKQLVGNIDDKMDDNGFLKQQAFNRRLYGVYTEKASRDIMINILFRRVAESKGKFICRNIIDDLLHLVKNKRGKIEAMSGQHDDSIMSYMIALYVLFYGNNLERYGYIRGHIPNAEDRNKGMEYETSLYEDLPDGLHPTNFKDTTQDEISLQLAKEVQAAKLELDLIDRVSFNTGNFRSVDESDEFEGSLPASFFEELNS